MSQDTENFEKLRQLLALKRHEQPPPGYLNDFSSRVMARIKAGETGDSAAFFERLIWEAPWLQRIWNALEAKPVLAGVCGVAMCGLMITGLLYSDSADVAPVALVPASESGTPPSGSLAMAAADHPLLPKPAMLGESSSTSPLAPISTGGPLLGEIGALRAQPASFTFPGGN